MEKKDIITAVFGAAVSLGGILLIFVGFIYAHSETLDLEKERKKYQFVAKCGMGPFVVCLVCAVFGLHWMLYQSEPCFQAAIYTFWAGIALPGIYGIGAFFLYL